MISAGGACIDVVTENDVVRVLPNLRTLWLMKSPSGVLETNSSSREKIGTTAEDEAALGLAGMVISEVAMKVAEDPTLSQHGNNFSVSSRVPQVLDVAPNCRQLARSIQLSTSPDHGSSPIDSVCAVFLHNIHRVVFHCV